MARYLFSVRGGMIVRPGQVVTVYVDEAATTPADIVTVGGVAIPGAAITITSNGVVPDFYGPDSVGTLYIKAAGAQSAREIEAEDGSGGGSGASGPPGPPGAPGAPGHPRFSGIGPPTTVIGASPGDTYLDLTNGDVYTLH